MELDDVKMRNWKSPAVFLVLGLLTGFGAFREGEPVRAAGEARLSIDTSTQYQTIEGWGTCLVNWGSLAGAQSLYLDPRFMKAYAEDLGCNMLRIALSPHALKGPSGRLDDPVVLVEDLQTNIDRMDFEHERIRIFGQVAQALKFSAREPDEVRIVGAIWSPPHWMKSPTGAEVRYLGSGPEIATPFVSFNGSDTVGGRLTQTPENLVQFGRYVVAWLKGYEQRFGLPLYALSLQNEISFENPFDSCTYSLAEGPDQDGDGDKDPEGGHWWQYAEALAAARDAFAHYGVATKIKGPHMGNLGESPASPWALSDQMRFIEAVVNHRDKTLIDFIDYYNSNGYWGNDSDAVKMWHAYLWGQDSLPEEPWAFWGFAPGIKSIADKPTWISEVGGASEEWVNGPGGTTGSGAITVAQKMQNALVFGNVSAYVYWQILNDGADRPDIHSLLGRSFDTTGKKFSSYRHFSRYVRPGSKRVKAVFQNGETAIGGVDRFDTQNSLNVSAFLGKEGESLTIVLINMLSEDQTVALELPASPRVQEFESFQTTASASWETGAALQVVDGVLRLTVPAQSVTTLYGQQVEGFSQYVPYFESGGGDFTGVTFSNPTPEVVTLDLTAQVRSPSASQLETSLELGPGQQIARLLDELFPLPAEQAARGWLKVESSQEAVGVFAQLGNHGLTRLDGALALRSAGLRLYLTRLNEDLEGHPVRTEVVLTNPGKNPVQVDLVLWGSDEVVPSGQAGEAQEQARESITIAPLGQIIESVDSLFEIPTGNGYLEIDVKGEGGLLAFERIEGRNVETLFALNASSSKPEPVLYSAQLASVPDLLFTNLKLVNPLNESRTLTLRVISNEGDEIARSGEIVLPPHGFLEGTVPSILEAYRGQSTAQEVPETMIGSLEVRLLEGAGVVGDVVFGLTDLGYAAALPLQGQLFRKAVFSHVSSLPGLFFTGFAFYNPGSEPAELMLSVFKSDGTQSGMAQIELGPGHRLSDVLSSLIPEVRSQPGGFLIADSDQPLVAQELFGTESTTLLSAVPPRVLE
ncbi:MAG: hypothetical protein JSU96_04180 [Acidobacteriota bacterium]|nr:MAG: hypothetical protein JSU96_04180 [Acidobacteriota bacterium]